MHGGLANLYLGAFTYMLQEPLPDGSVVITLSKRGKGKTYRFVVKDLYGEHEKVLSHEVIDNKAEPKPWIAERMKKAKEEKEKEGNG